jgi:hypothetical protein
MTVVVITGFRLSQSIRIDLLKPAIACLLALLSCSSFHTEARSKYDRMQALVITLHLAPPKIGESRYHYVPFQVPFGASQIDISYDYDHANGSNALDIGLFDSRSTELAGDVTGFRGWSGGRRSEFFVSREAATPGYIPGELPGGTWRIILGLYRIVPEGVDVSFKVSIEGRETNLISELSSPQLFAAQPPSPLVMAGEPNSDRVSKTARRWVSGDLHMHTVNSDGDWTVPQLITAAKEARLDFICITDHNTFSHHAEIDQLSRKQTDVLLIRGEEITTYGGHANAWGLPANVLIDFRVPPGDQKAMARVAAETHRRRALISINHPFAACVGCNWSYDQEAVGFDAIEVWNGSWDTADEQALALWDKLLQKGRRVTAIASSDSHRPANPIGQAATHADITGGLSVTAILKSIRAGRIYLTNTATGPTITFTSRRVLDGRTYMIGDTLRIGKSQRIRFRLAAADVPASATVSLISQGSVIRSFLADANAQVVEVDSAQDGYFRMEVRDQNGKMLALTNPIYVEIRR